MSINSTVVVFALKVAGALSSLLVSWLYLNYLSATELGRYAFVLSATIYAATTVNYGQHVLVLKNLVEKESVKSRASLDQSYAVVCMLFCVVYPVYMLLVWSVYPSALLFFGAFFLFIVLCQLRSPYLLSNKRFFVNAVYVDFLRGGLCCLMVSFLALSVVFGSGGNLEIAAHSSAALVVALLCVGVARTLGADISVAVRSVGGLAVKGDFFRKFSKGLTSGWSIFVVSFLGLLIAQFDRIYLGTILGYDALGVYFAAYSVTAAVSLFNQALVSRQTPRMIAAFSRRDDEAVKDLSRSNAVKSLLYSFFIIVCFYFLLPIVQTFFNVSGNEFAVVSLILLFAQVVSVSFGFGATLLLYSDDDGRSYLVKALAISFFSSTFLGIILVYALGIVGAALGTSVGVILNRLIPFLYYKNRGLNLSVFRF